ncbi:hypothetical protein HYR99_01635 [Candidatus Poribacteria bacterium]|nr:hypothetical protein [Candidatus Poribacteria bacterium]
MQECDLLKAVEQAAFQYLFGVLMNRVGKLLGKRALVALVVLVGAVLVDRWMPMGGIIGLAVAIGIAIWSFYDAVKTARNVIEKFRRGWWQIFKRLPRQLLDDFFLDCLNRKPECCELFQREVSQLLMEWVKGLKPGWKKGSPFIGSLKWHQMQKDIKRRITDQLKECCT